MSTKTIECTISHRIPILNSSIMSTQNSYRSFKSNKESKKLHNDTSKTKYERLSNIKESIKSTNDDDIKSQKILFKSKLTFKNLKASDNLVMIGTFLKKSIIYSFFIIDPKFKFFNGSYEQNLFKLRITNKDHFTNKKEFIKATSQIETLPTLPTLQSIRTIESTSSQVLTY